MIRQHIGSRNADNDAAALPPIDDNKFFDFGICGRHGRNSESTHLMPQAYQPAVANFYNPAKPVERNYVTLDQSERPAANFSCIYKAVAESGPPAANK
jgi:hypothetical protein